MPKQTPRAKAKQPEEERSLIEAEKLLDELVAEDPRLGVARKHARDIGGGEDGIGEDAVQIYRQRLRE